MRKRSLVVIGAVLMIVGGLSIAQAALTVDGSGSGRVRTIGESDVKALTVNGVGEMKMGSCSGTC